MADSNSHNGPGAGGVRRRRSTHDDDDERAIFHGQASGPQDQNTAGATPVSATVPGRSASVSSPVGSPSTPADSNARTVRFSADLDGDARPTEARGPSSLVSPSDSTSRNTRSRGGLPGLSLDIPLEDQRGEEGRSPLSPRPTPSPRGSTAHKSPLSPTSRARGYSLRSSLFRRTMENPPSAIELEEAGSSGSGSTGGFSSSTRDSKKSNTPTVTIASLPDRPSKPAKSKKDNSNISGLPTYQSWVQSRTRKAGIIRRISDITQKVK